MSFTPNLPPVAAIGQKTIIDLIKAGRRLDGRGLTDFRDFSVEIGVIEKANGSALVNLGKTKVMVGVKVQDGNPFPDTPAEGVLTVNAELVPLASPSFEAGPPGENAIELARVVDRGIRESKAIDVKKLCIKEGEKVFVVYNDIYVLDHDGNLIDTSAIASLAALLTGQMSDYDYKDGKITYKAKKIPLPIQNQPVAVTVAKIGDSLIVDPNLEEEQVMTARLTVTSDKDGKICAMQKGGMGDFSPDEVKQAVRICLEKGAVVRSKILEVAK
ncbi:MAG: exosome complex protein Rrp42 [archaeon]